MSISSDFLLYMDVKKSMWVDLVVGLIVLAAEKEAAREAEQKKQVAEADTNC